MRQYGKMVTYFGDHVALTKGANLIRRWNIPLFILVGYIIIVFLSAPSVWLNWQSVTIGWHEDVGIFLWNMWWMHKAVVELHANPFYTAWLNYPDGANLWFHTLTPLPSLLSIPLQEFFGLIGTYNILLFTSMVASAVTACWLAYTITKNYTASFIAGLVFAFAPTQVRHILLGQLNLIAIYFIPLYIVFYIRYLKTAKRMYLLATTLILVCSLLNDWHFGLFLGLFNGVFLIARIIFRRTPMLAQEPQEDAYSIATLFWRTLHIWATCCIVLSPFIFAILTDSSQESINTISSRNTIIRRSADPLAFFIPTPRHPLWGEWAYSQHMGTMKIYPSVVSLSLSALLLSAVAVITKWRQSRFWVFSAIIIALFALGPELRLLGQRTGISLPYDILLNWEFLRIARSPARFTLLVMLCVSMLAALGTTTLLERISTDLWKGIWGLLIAAIICFELVFPSIEGSTLDSTPAFYRDGTLNSAGALAELRNPEFKPYQNNMYFATLHERPVLFEHLARDPHPSVALHYLRTALIQYEHDMVDPVENWRCLTNIYHITHLAIYRYEWKDEFSTIQQKITDLGFPLVQTTPTADLYRIPHNNNTSSCILLEDGWSTPRNFADSTTAYRWMDQSATISLISSNDQDVTLQFEAHPFAMPRAIQVYVDGIFYEEYMIDTIPTQVELPLELQKKRVIIEFRSIETASDPDNYGYNEDIDVSVGFSKMRVIPSQ